MKYYKTNIEFFEEQGVLLRRYANPDRPDRAFKLEYKNPVRPSCINVTYGATVAETMNRGRGSWNERNKKEPCPYCGGAL